MLPDCLEDRSEIIKDFDGHLPVASAMKGEKFIVAASRIAYTNVGTAERPCAAPPDRGPPRQAGAGAGPFRVVHLPSVRQRTGKP